MTLNDLDVSMSDEASFKRALRKDEIVALLKGTFSIGRLPYVHVARLSSGSEIRVKFFNVEKPVLNSKGKAVPGKESWLSYSEVSVFPAGQKPYSYTQDVTQHVWGTSKSKATEKHHVSVNELRGQAEALGIDLSAASAWCETFTQNY